MPYRPQPRAARNALLWGLGTFVVLQAAFSGVVQDWLPQFRDPFFEVRARTLRQRIKQTPADLVVMLGSSRTLNALRGAEVEPELAQVRGRPVILYNLGIPGAGPTTHLMVLNRLRERKIRPDLLLVEVLPLYLGEKTAETPPGVPAEWLAARDIDCLDRHGLLTEHVQESRLRALAAPWYTHRMAIVSAFAPRLLPGALRQDWAWRCDQSGWMPIPDRDPTPAMRRDAVESARKGYEPGLRDFTLGGRSCQALRQLLAECQRDGVRTALVLMPEGPIFQSWYAPATTAQVNDFLSELSAEFGCAVVNARDWVPEEAFSDSHHALRRGGVAFTKRLAQEAILPLLKAECPETKLARVASGQ